MKYLRRPIVLICLLIVVSGIFFYLGQRSLKANSSEQKYSVKQIQQTYSKEIAISAGDTYASVMSKSDLATSTIQELFAAALPVYDLSKIHAGKKIKLIYSSVSNELKQLIYFFNNDQQLLLNREEAAATSTPKTWSAKILAIPYETKIRTVVGSIESSLYESALAQGLDERAVDAFADSLEWTIDFAWGVQKGDSYKFIYEERYLNGQYAMPGQVLAGKFNNAGKNYYVFYYQSSSTPAAFFNENGESAQKMFLKAPLAFKYISSGFTTGRRYISAFNIATGHRAVDYAATYGTPIRSVGDGKVAFAGWNGSYGQMVKVRHNGTYQTNYGHMSKIAVRVGQAVKQGQTIGYVGSTGLSTGPHLHFEMEKNGVKINPLKEIIPPSQGIAAGEKVAYLAAIQDLKNQLDN